MADPQISEAAKRAVCDVLDSGQLAAGEEVRAFEREFADYIGVEHAVATSNGTTALHAMLAAAGIGDGDAVITTPFSFIASANAIVHAGAEPVFGDIHRDTFNLDPSTVRSILEVRDDVAGILPVHLYGLPADMDAFRQLAVEFEVKLFEDAAQAHGATYEGQKVGSIGDAAAFSFYPTKNMTTGEGGMITTDDARLAELAANLANHGRDNGYHHVDVGYNFRLTNIQAVIGREQLGRLPDWIEARRQNAKSLTDQLEAVDQVETPAVPPDRRHAFHLYTVRVPGRNHLAEDLTDAGIGTGVYYPMSIPKQPAYDQPQSYPHAEAASREVLSLPVHPSLSSTDMDRIASAVTRGVEYQP